ncbi:MAG: hypothetical protein ACFFE4_08895 [Candidatus Thorarchaeota archaeon]
MTFFKLRNIFLILFLSILCCNIFSVNTNADPIPIETPGIGGIIPKNDTNCSITNAEVLVEIDATNLNQFIDFSFSSNYTIFNPGKTINLTIAAPFSHIILGEKLNGFIKMNNSKIPFRTYNSSDSTWDEFTLWKDYFLASDFFYTTLLICNITILENLSITLEYAFDTNLTINLDDLGSLIIRYYVGTSRAWEGNINESLEFKVFGKIPDDFYQEFCNVSDLQNGKSYLWEWKEEIISINYVYITYYGNYTWNPFSYIIPFGNSILTVSTIGIFLLIIIVKLSRTKKYKLYSSSSSS